MGNDNWWDLDPTNDFEKGSEQSTGSQDLSNESADVSRRLLAQTAPIRAGTVGMLNNFLQTGTFPVGLDFSQTYTPLTRQSVRRPMLDYGPLLDYRSVPFTRVNFQVLPLTGVVQDAADEEKMLQQAALDAGQRGGALSNALFQASLRRRMSMDALRAQHEIGQTLQEQGYNLAEAGRGRDFGLAEAGRKRDFGLMEAGASRDFDVAEAAATRDFDLAERAAARDFGLNRQMAEQATKYQLFNTALGTSFGQVPIALQGLGTAAGNLNTLGGQRIQQNMAFQQGLGQLAGFGIASAKLR